MTIQSDISLQANSVYDLPETILHSGEPYPKDTLYVGQYLLERLAQLGITKMFGVPGDFNLGFLDFVEDHPKIDWVGNCNELNAAYAADGYARVHHGKLGALTTTFGVGELSALNGIAGAFAEHVPVLHVIGVPSTSQLKAHSMLHHTLGDGRFDVYYEIAQQVTISQTSLTSKEHAASEIDRVITDCLVLARPVYLMLPSDMAYERISSDRLKTPLNTLPPENDENAENFVLDEIVKLIDEAQNGVIILVDAHAVRHNVKREVKELCERTGFPVYATPMGKTAVDESYERYGGIYNGVISHDEVKEKVESAKLVLYIGPLKSDVNTGSFSQRIPVKLSVEFHYDYTRVQHAGFPGIGMKHLLSKLTQRLQPFNEGGVRLEVFKHVPEITKEENDITQAYLWPRMGQFFEPNDIIVVETGTSSFGILNIPFPTGAVFLTQMLWSSIGWAVGSTLGAAYAAQDRGFGRTILFIGDGSLQLAVQELSVMIHRGLKPIIFVLNNNGYTIERYLHGMNRKYNDIDNWRWTKLLEAFGGEEGTTVKSYQVRTKQQLSSLLSDQAFARTEVIQLVEIILPQKDAPVVLKAQAELLKKSNPKLQSEIV